MRICDRIRLKTDECVRGVIADDQRLGWSVRLDGGRVVWVPAALQHEWGPVVSAGPKHGWRWLDYEEAIQPGDMLHVNEITYQVLSDGSICGSTMKVVFDKTIAQTPSVWDHSPENGNGFCRAISGRAEHAAFTRIIFHEIARKVVRSAVGVCPQLCGVQAHHGTDVSAQHAIEADHRHQPHRAGGLAGLDAFGDRAQNQGAIQRQDHPAVRQGASRSYGGGGAGWRPGDEPVDQG